MTGEVTNLPASVRQRLLNMARRDGVEFEYQLLRYANERLLYRLSQSDIRDRFVLKGAMVFLVWGPDVARQSRDVDLLGLGAMGVEYVHEVFRMLCQVDVVDDGLRFDAGSVRVDEIREQTEYGGVRVLVRAHLDTARVQVQVDIAFGDAVSPDPAETAIPPLLDFPAPRLRAYPRETVIAEKFEAMVRLGVANTRLKDFYDVWSLARAFEFDGATLAGAVRTTFERRQTETPTGPPLSLEPDFALQRERQWRAFGRRVGVDDLPTFVEVTDEIRRFLMPICGGIGSGHLPGRWYAGAGWDRSASG